jgi:selenocysteine lyase/cysteine desulfurase
MTASGVDVALPAIGRRSGGAETLGDDPDWDGVAVDELRAREFARLDAQGQVYLDYTGGSLYGESQLREHQALLRDGVLGNPHSHSPAADAATRLADRARAAVLAFFDASPDEYEVVFTANATAALRLVGEAYPFRPGGRLLLTADNHNSVNGIREFARSAGAEPTYVPLTPDLRVDGRALVAELDRAPDGPPSLFAFPAQSNYSGVRHPLAWIDEAHARGWDVLLDASAFVPANRLDLSVHRPDFVAVSWYKVFGYPTGIGSLIACRDALARLRRPWFAGGSIGVASVVLPRNTWGEGHVGFEDGTVDYLGLPGIEIGLRFTDAIGIDTIHRRVQALTRRVLAGMTSIRRPDGGPAVRLYGPADTVDRGGTIPFNVLGAGGRVVGFWEVEAAAAAAGISIRTGCFCNPGASETARGITADDMARIFALGHVPTIDELEAIHPDKAFGAVRASVGVATTERDVERFLGFLAGFAAGR